VICKAAVDLIRSAEGLRIFAYADPGTRGAPWSIGYGRAHGVSPGDTCTKDEAEQWLFEDIGDAERCLDAWVDVDLSENQRGALVSWIYNLGCENFKGSTLLQLLNAGNFNAVPAQIRRWNKASGVAMPGLITRREAEAKLFIT
jgi:lysozyme